MPKLFVLGAALLLLDVFPGNGCGCAPSTTAGPCQSTCDCSATMNAPIKCPGRWECNPQKTCQYSCFETCMEDGGCATAGKTCTDSFCKTTVSCP
jgi:hypothetical protein